MSQRDCDLCKITRLSLATFGYAIWQMSEAFIVALLVAEAPIGD